jgi:hypothetical protein
MANIVPVLTAARFSGLFQTAPVNVVEPTMIEAPKPAVFDSPVAQIGSPVRTVDT